MLVPYRHYHSQVVRKPAILFLKVEYSGNRSKKHLFEWWDARRGGGIWELARLVQRREVTH